MLRAPGLPLVPSLEDRLKLAHTAMWVFLSVAGCALSGCSQGKGEACQIKRDCEDGLMCCISGGQVRGTCQLSDECALLGTGTATQASASGSGAAGNAAGSGGTAGAAESSASSAAGAAGTDASAAGSAGVGGSSGSAGARDAGQDDDADADAGVDSATAVDAAS
jgi:hypothetical protein